MFAGFLHSKVAPGLTATQLSSSVHQRLLLAWRSPLRPYQGSMPRNAAQSGAAASSSPAAGWHEARRGFSTLSPRRLGRFDAAPLTCGSFRMFSMRDQAVFDQEVADAVCAQIAEGDSLRKACEAQGIKHPTFLLWVKTDAALADQYTRAREVGYALLADEIIEISDDSKGDVYQDADGNDRTDTERVARAKLRVDSRKWMLSKMLPKVYGDKIEANLTGEIGIRVIERRIVDAGDS
jgi:hypothetical protein